MRSDTTPICLCAGLAVADHLCVPIPRMPAAGELTVSERLELNIGGCAANVAADLGKLGVNVGISARVGRDPFGQFINQQLRKAGVDTTLLIETEGVDTSGTLVINIRGEDRRFIHAFGANAHFEGTEIPAKILAQARVLYVGGFFAMPRLLPAQLARLFQQAREAGVTTVLDVVIPGPASHYMESLEVVLPWTDAFLPNSDEGLLITGLPDPQQQAERFREAGASTVVITCGDQGALVLSARDRFRVNSHKTEYVDGTGSGDAFAAGFILGLLEQRSLQACVAWGSALGASCVRASGATAGVFTRVELQRFVDENPLQFT